MGSERQSDIFVTLSTGPGAIATPPAPLLTDASVNADFEINETERIYRKTGLEVFRGTISSTQQEVVVKRIFSEGNRREDALDEARMLEELDHPNVIKCIRVIEQANYVDIVMEQGRSLACERKERKFSPKEISRIVADLCAGLVYIHTKGIVHFDLKCDNIIMVDGCAKLADFGSSLSLRGSNQTTLAAPRGTIPFMSPEIIRSLPVDASTDIWSLGATLFELVAGVAPFQKLSAKETIMWEIAIKKSLPSLPADLEVPEEIADLILSCTHSDTKLRPTAQCLLSRSSG